MNRVDPEIPDWKNVELPKTWPDHLNFRQFKDLRLVFQKALGKKRQKVQIPEELPGVYPQYLLQEFHNLPNGNYSHHMAKGYLWGFDFAMLGQMNKARRRIAESLASCESVLDVGCGTGKLAFAFKEMGIKEVWGLDPSPYLLRIAALSFPEVHFVQGLAEKNDFAAERFEGIGVCFMFHEVPHKISNQSLEEFHRILKPGGLVSVVEPSPQQMYEKSWFRLFRLAGFYGPYFRILAKRVYEPFAHQWHQRNLEEWFGKHGFELKSNEICYPFRFLLAQKK